MVVHNQGERTVVNPEDRRCGSKLLLGIVAYSVLFWRGGITLFCFTWHVNVCVFGSMGRCIFFVFTQWFSLNEESS